MKPETLRRVMNIWPPFLFSGIRINKVSRDWRHVEVQLKLHRWNANYFGTQFGGHMFKMCDPFWAILATERLGKAYHVWDAAGDIEFISPGRETVYAVFDFDDAARDEIVAATADGEKHLRWFENEIRTAAGVLVARTRKQLYVRRKDKGRQNVRASA